MRPPLRATRSTSVDAPSSTVTYRSGLPAAVTPCAPTSMPSTGRPSAAAVAVTASATITATTRTRTRIEGEYVRHPRRGPLAQVLRDSYGRRAAWWSDETASGCPAVPGVSDIPVADVGD